LGQALVNLTTGTMLYQNISFIISVGD